MYEEEDILGAPARLVWPRGEIVKQIYAHLGVGYSRQETPPERGWHDRRWSGSFCGIDIR